MELQYFGANCLRISTKKVSMVLDDNLADLGAKKVLKPGDVSILTNFDYKNVEPEAKLVINQPGDFEVSDIAILGVAARAYGDEEGTFNSTIFKLDAQDVKIAFVGNVAPGLSDVQLELLGEVDVLVIAVGDNETTLSAKDALEIVKKINPSVLIPTHYENKGITYPSKQSSLEEVVTDLAMEVSERTIKLKLKSSEFTDDDNTKLVVLEIA